jgi:hypothetical protein
MKKIKKEIKFEAESTEAKDISNDKKPTENIETGGPQGPDPTRYGDWERKGRCVDF